jgi:protoporphyrinogen/coproporphyrinogen III oxidase
MQNDIRQTEVTIIGAGLTGLSLAHKLKKQGKKVLVVEKNSQTGGVIGTQEKDGFIYETGPNTGVLSTPDIVELIEELSEDCTLATANKKANKRLILKNGKWHALPSGLISAVTTPLFTFKDKLRVLAEPFRAKGKNPHESLADLVKRRLGKSFLDYAIDPFIGGIYAGDPEKIIPKYALPKLYNLEQNYGSFIKGAVKKAKEPKSSREEKATKEVFAVKGGLKHLVDALEKSIGSENIILNARQTVVMPNENGYEIRIDTESGDSHTIHSSKVVSTVGAYRLQTLFPFLTEEELAPVRNLRYAAVTLAAVGFKKWNGRKLDAFGGLVPSKEGKKILGILFPSAIFNDRAPEGGAMLSVFIGGIRQPDAINMSDDEIKQTVFNDIRETLDAENPEPDVFEIFRYKHAIPQYEISSGLRLEAIANIEKKYPGLLLAGNIRDGIGMADRVKQAFEIAREL